MNLERGVRLTGRGVRLGAAYDALALIVEAMGREARRNGCTAYNFTTRPDRDRLRTASTPGRNGKGR